MRAHKPNYNLDAFDLEEVKREIARRSLLEFTKYTMHDYQVNWHHELVGKALDDFFAGLIQYLAIFLPTQTGKSELSSRRGPAYVLGKFPDKRIGLTSYSHPRAARFSRNIQQIIDTPEYAALFPETRIPRKNVRTDAHGGELRNADIFEIIGRKGSLISTGIGGQLTGDSLDILIMDDTVKNRADAMSLAMQVRNNDWFDSVAKLRLDNYGQILMVNTRWDEDDLAGYILKKKEFNFKVITLPALKVNDDNPDDPRKIGEALWEAKHSRKRYEAQRQANPVVFEALGQQNPGTPTEVLVYSKPWIQIDRMPDYSEFWGLDFGFSSPAALLKCMQKGDKAYMEEKLYKTGLDIDELARELKAAGVRGNPVYCDSAEPATIKGLRKRGINATAANKSLLAGIMHLQSLEVYYTSNSENLALEKKKYQYPVGTDNLPVKGADPIDNYNHLMDAARYAFFTKASAGSPGAAWLTPFSAEELEEIRREKAA